MTRTCTALLGLTFAAIAPLQAQRADSIIQRTSTIYRQLHSLTANFDQVVRNEMIGTFKSRGALAQSGPSRLSMRFSDPAGEAIVIDGTSIWIYTPSTAPGQVLRAPIVRAAGYGVNLLGWLLDRPTERYTVRYLRADTVSGTAVDVLQLTPAVEGLPFTAATLWLATRDGLPRRIQVSEPSGNHRTLTLTKVRTNMTLPADTFVFTAPKGVRVIDQ